MGMNTRTGAKKILEKSRSSRHVTRVLSFTSGKGGVGKTHTVINTAIALASAGKSVLVLDGDMGLANIHVMMDLHPRYTLHDVLKGERGLADIILEGPGGVSIIPAASGIEGMCALSPQDRFLILEAVEKVGIHFDYLLIDTQAGIGPEVMSLNSASAEIVCVVTPEPTSLTDTYALIKVLSSSYGEKRVAVVVNQADSEREGRRTFDRLADVVGRFLNVDVNYLGWVPKDSTVHECVMSRRPTALEFPSCPASRAISAVAHKIDNEFVPQIKGGFQLFFRQLLGVSDYGAEAGS